ncbi:sigma-54 dependent transcriptional regulator [Desulfonatronum sp. SC1]|uniref:sigma-54-dependent transcriptional regulator n=1 Tax=Desulfonatronum sp. SC1 TaxID=2109626 RepID=UPI000D3018B8|nr:sigma-54 dependent transcriptional regulator [Desulfonatronum sp. SC1]PTN32566.1 two-component system response regulator [Desulfonatronum sp. SC1]
MPDSIPHLPVYILDDEQALTRSFFLTLKSFGFQDVRTFHDGRKILGLFSERESGVLLLDLSMPDISGEEVLGRVRECSPLMQVVVVTGINEADTAIRCIRAGAFDYLVKPVDADRLVTTVFRAMSHAAVLEQNFRLRHKLLTGGLDRPEIFQGIITQDARVRAIFSYMEVVASLSEPVLVTGETGTGKDLLAAALHEASGRKGRFVGINAAGLDDNVFADTLFGHVKGAFTDARESREGLVARAAGGSLFLDEIGDLSPASQVKLLKLIQDRVYYPLGSDTPRTCTARIIAATNRELEATEGHGRFREDLLYRINTYRLHLPPLRDRRDDIPLLTEFFLTEACSELNVNREPLSPRTAELLTSYRFPGNVRELRSLVFSAMAGGGMAILEQKIADLAGIGLASLETTQRNPARSTSWQYPEPLPTLQQAGEILVEQALRTSKGNQSKASAMLGITRQALNKRIKKVKAGET